MIFEVNHDHFSLYGNYIASFRSRSTNQKLIPCKFLLFLIFWLKNHMWYIVNKLQSFDNKYW